MALEYYDDAIVKKLKSWTPTNAQLRVLDPDQTQELFKLTADDTKDSKFTLPCIALSRTKDIELLMNIKNSRSFDGLRLQSTGEQSIILNQIPVKVEYQLDIFAKKANAAEEYVREYLFKLINNPKIIIYIPYNGIEYRHVANIRVQTSISNTSDISERIFPGQFTRWTVNFEIQDAMLFSIKYKDNWRLVIDGEDPVTGVAVPLKDCGDLEIAEEIEHIEPEFNEYLNN